MLGVCLTEQNPSATHLYALRFTETHSLTYSYRVPHTHAHSNRPNESKMDAFGKIVGCVINCCLSTPTDNDGLHPGEFAGNRFYFEGLFIVVFIGGVVCLGK